MIDTNGFWQGDVKNIKKDGTTFLCQASVSAFDHPQYGQVDVSVHTDITKRKRAELASRVEELTSREREVMDLVVVGKATKRIAADLRISPKTVEAHRARIMRKMATDSLAELVQMAVAVDSTE